MAGDDPPLVLAARSGDVSTVRTCLLRDPAAARDAQDQFGRSALYYACLYGHVEVVRELCQRGASDPNGTCVQSAMRDSGVVEVLREFSLLGASPPGSPSSASSCSADEDDGKGCAPPRPVRVVETAESSLIKPQGSAERWRPESTPAEERARALREVRAAVNQRLVAGESHLKHARKYARQLREGRIKRRPHLLKICRGQQIEDREVHESQWMAKHGTLDPKAFTRGMKRELRKWFDKLDTDGSGEIDCTELADPLISTGFAESMMDVVKLIRTVDLDGSGEIGFQEFLKILKPRQSGTDAAIAAAAAHEEGHENYKARMEREGDPANAMVKLQETLTKATSTLPLEALINTNRRQLIMEAVMALSSRQSPVADSTCSSPHQKAKEALEKARRLAADRLTRQNFRYKLRALGHIVDKVKKDVDQLDVTAGVNAVRATRGSGYLSSDDDDLLAALEESDDDDMRTLRSAGAKAALEAGVTEAADERSSLYKRWECVLPMLTRGHGVQLVHKKHSQSVPDLRAADDKSNGGLGNTDAPQLGEDVYVDGVKQADPHRRLTILVSKADVAASAKRRQSRLELLQGAAHKVRLGVRLSRLASLSSKTTPTSLWGAESMPSLLKSPAGAGGDAGRINPDKSKRGPAKGGLTKRRPRRASTMRYRIFPAVKSDARYPGRGKRGTVGRVSIARKVSVLNFN